MTVDEAIDARVAELLDGWPPLEPAQVERVAAVLAAAEQSPAA